VHVFELDSPYALHNEFTATPKDVHSLSTPSRFVVSLTEPVEEGSRSDLRCMYYDQSVDSWVPQETACKEHVPAFNSNKMTCCTDHFSTFAVQNVVYGHGFFRPGSPMFYCTVVNILLLILVLVGKHLDKNHALLYGNAYTLRDSEPA
jgi:hypothetical protein